MLFLINQKIVRDVKNFCPLKSVIKRQRIALGKFNYQDFTGNTCGRYCSKPLQENSEKKSSPRNEIEEKIVFSSSSHYN